MSNPSPDAGGFEIIVGDDGISAEELAQHGITPGTHLRVVPEPAPAAKRSPENVLADVIDVDAWTEALLQAKQERIEDVERRSR
jgi:hypothetical protein